MVRPVANRTWGALMLDTWPEGPAAVVDFGIDSEEHYRALQHAIRCGPLNSPEKLDAVLGDGPAITKACREAEGCPHPEIVFTTSYDLAFAGLDDSEEEDEDLETT